MNLTKSEINNLQIAAYGQILRLHPDFSDGSEDQIGYCHIGEVSNRIVACVNACRGSSTDELEDTKLLSMLDSYWVDIQQREDLQAQVDELRAKADDLLDILSSIENDNGQISQPYWLKIQETVHKYTGGNK